MTIKQRDFFTHYVHVETAGKEICWNFYTRKKNVSFGLFRQIEDFSTSIKPTPLLVSTGNGVVSEMSPATNPNIATERSSMTSLASPGGVRISTGKVKRVEPLGNETRFYNYRVYSHHTNLSL